MAEEKSSPKPMVGVSTIVKNGDRILLIKRNEKVHGAGTWTVPGGHLDFGEAFEHCAIREVKEETGVDIDTVKFRVITNDVFEKEQKHYITIWLEAKYAGGEAHLAAPYESTEIGWFTWDALPEPLFLPLQHLLSGETYPSQTTEYKIGPALENASPIQ